MVGGRSYCQDCSNNRRAVGLDCVCGAGVKMVKYQVLCLLQDM